MKQYLISEELRDKLIANLKEDAGPMQLIDALRETAIVPDVSALVKALERIAKEGGWTLAQVIAEEALSAYRGGK